LKPNAGTWTASQVNTNDVNSKISKVSNPGN
jgi:hypothetical protein